MINFNYHWTLVYPLHILAVIGIYFTGFSLFHLLLLILGWVLFSGLGSAVGYHRILSHRALEPRKGVEKIITILGALSCQGPPISWVAIHRGYHHKGTDTSRDFHSPNNGIWHSYFGWTYKVKDGDVNLKYSADLLRDNFQVFVYKYYYFIIWCIWSISLLVLGWEYTLWLFVLPGVVALHSDLLVNVVSHIPSLGYRNFERKDQSTNIPWLAYFTWGQCWHNNHHEKPKEYDFGTSCSGKWWEYDPSRVFKILFKKQ